MSGFECGARCCVSGNCCGKISFYKDVDSGNVAVKETAPGFTICNTQTATKWIETLDADATDSVNYDLATAKKGAKV